MPSDNEIEIKVMLEPHNIKLVEQWFETQNVLAHHSHTLINTYFDTPDLFFAREEMGLRVRSVNQQHEMTLKMKGDIVGGLHIRPEYNIALEDNHPDFKRLVETHHLQIAHTDEITNNLLPTFSTDFERKTWLIAFQSAEIEIALDQGWVENPFSKEQICEIEFELKQGTLQTLFAFINTMPLCDGMWLSSLSKAQRGYLVGQNEKIVKQIEKLTACRQTMSLQEQYQYNQQLADFLRLDPTNTLLQECVKKFETIPTSMDMLTYLKSADYLRKQLNIMQALY